MSPSDPPVYPHLNIYPAVTGVSMPVPSTPVPFASNSTKAADVHLTVDYPSLVICKSLTTDMGPGT